MRELKEKIPHVHQALLLLIVMRNRQKITTERFNFFGRLMLRQRPRWLRWFKTLAPTESPLCALLPLIQGHRNACQEAASYSGQLKRCLKDRAKT